MGLSGTATIKEKRRVGSQLCAVRGIPRAAASVAVAGIHCVPIVIVRIRRPFWLLRRVLLYRLEYHLNRSLELRIMSVSPGFRIHLDLDVRRNTVVLDLPLSLRRVEGEVRRRHRASVDQDRIPSDAHQSAPGALADQRTNARMSKHPWHQVTARAGV